MKPKQRNKQLSEKAKAEIKRLVKEAYKRGAKRIYIKAKPGECGYKAGLYRKKKAKIFYGLNTNAM